MESKRRRRRFWLMAAVLVVGVGFALFSSDPPGCSSRVVRELVSPDGHLRAVQRVGACVLTEDVYWLVVRSPFWFGTEVFRHSNEFDFCWKSANELVVESLPAPYKMETEARGARIIYGGMQECGPGKSL